MKVVCAEDKMQMDGEETQIEEELHYVPAAQSQFSVKHQCVRKRLISG